MKKEEEAALIGIVALSGTGNGCFEVCEEAAHTVTTIDSLKWSYDNPISTKWGENRSNRVSTKKRVAVTLTCFFSFFWLMTVIHMNFGTFGCVLNILQRSWCSEITGNSLTTWIDMVSVAVYLFQRKSRNLNTTSILVIWLLKPDFINELILKAFFMCTFSNIKEKKIMSLSQMCNQLIRSFHSLIRPLLRALCLFTYFHMSSWISWVWIIDPHNLDERCKMTS